MNGCPPLKSLLARKILDNRDAVDEWCRLRELEAEPPFYCSIDLRDSGYKIVPVDSNLYPAGFNNICPEDHRTAPFLFKAWIEKRAQQLGMPSPQKILILPESHTSNRFYAENLYYLRALVRNAGFKSELGWYGELPPGSPPDSPVRLESETGKELHATPITVEEGVLRAGTFVPDWIVLNNDFSAGYPKLLDQVKQPIVPSHRLGWHTRRKSEHFRHYNQLAEQFARLIGIDPWQIQVATEEVTPVNFNEGIGVEETALTAERMLNRLKKEYAERAIDRAPYLYVKSNSGTYGMGIMTLHSADELRAMNRRAKNKMSVGKGRAAIHSVAVQEGVPTTTLVDRLPAEPCIYLIGGELIGGFLRTNTERNVEDNLNSQGMVFRKLCMSDLRVHDPEEEEELPIYELAYGAIARLSSLAAGLELKGQ